MSDTSASDTSASSASSSAVLVPSVHSQNSSGDSSAYTAVEENSSDDNSADRVARTYKLPRRLIDDLKAYSDAHSLTDTAVVRSALEAYLHADSAPASRVDLVSATERILSAVSALHVEAVVSPPSPPARVGFWRRLLGGAHKE